jgi:hypothetical protein
MFILNKNIDTFNKIIPPNSILSICFTIVISIPYFIGSFIILVLNDYFKKYWLYDSTLDTYYIHK